MVDKVVKPGRIIDFASYLRAQRPSRATAMSGRFCRYCGAELFDDDREEDCSSAGILQQGPTRTRPPRRFRAD